MLKTLLLVVFTLALTLGCSNKVDNGDAGVLKCDKPKCASVKDYDKTQCETSKDKALCSTDKCPDAKAKKAKCGTPCEKPCCANKAKNAKCDEALCKKPCCAKNKAEKDTL